MNPTPACDPEAVSGLLDGTLPPAVESALHAHLEACAGCRSRLEGQAAGPEWWAASREHLGDLTADFRTADGEDEGELPFGLRDLLGPSDDPTSLGRLGVYEVRGVVGRGGMGVVLKAFDPGLSRVVAVKVLAPEFAGDRAARQRFAREARAAAAVAHEAVVAIHAVSEARGLPFLVMPYVRGGSLERRLRVSGPLSVEATLRVGVQVARGLAAAHAQGLVHRDIKPANILLEEGVERAAISDFGLARAADDVALTRTGVIAGTPQYMSPEQAGGERVDHRSDLFSLSGVLYAALTGRPPFAGDSSYGVIRAIREGEPVPLDGVNPAVPPWLVRLVARLHAKDPLRRPADATAVADLLEQCLAHLRDPAGSPVPAGLAGPRRRFGWALWAAALVPPTLLLALVYAWPRPPVDRGPKPEPPEAERPTDDRWADGVNDTLRRVRAGLNEMGTESSPPAKENE